jgi:hypothetical protein
MTKSGAESAVIISAFVTLASTSYDSLSGAQLKGGGLKGHLPAGRTVAATFLAFAVLGGIAEAAPEVGAWLSITVATTAFIAYGLPAVAKQFGTTDDQQFLKRLRING